MDGLYLGLSCPRPPVDFPPSNSIPFPIYASAAHLPMSSSEGDDQRNDAVTGIETGRSFVKASVQSLIKALSGSASKTVVTPVYLATGGARRAGRDIGDEFLRQSIEEVAEFYGKRQNDPDMFGLNSETLRQSENRETEGGITDFEAGQITPVSGSEKMRFGYGDTEANGLKRESNLVPASRSFPEPSSDGNTEARGLKRESNFVPASRLFSEPNFVPGSRSLFGPAPSDIAGILKPEGKFVPARHSSFAPDPSVFSGIRSLVGSGTRTRLPRTELGERETDLGEREVDTCEHGSIPDGCFTNLSEKPPFYAALSSFDPGIRTYGTYGREEASEMGQSTRYGRNDTQNVTSRDSKRPKERSRDRAYKTRFSMDAPTMPNRSPIHHLGGNTWPSEEGIVHHRPVVSVAYGPAHSPGSPLPPSTRKNNRPSLSPQAAPFEISLIHEGHSVSHRVWPDMGIAQLMVDAGAIFGLDPSEIVLLLFSAFPVTLRKDGLISGPPPVLPGAKVMVFNVHGQSHARNLAGSVLGHRHVPEEPPSHPVFSSKLLGSFKLPKFDGLAKSWKGWEKSFQRFLGFHQLDYVLEEDFPSLLWVTPGAAAANKMVFFLVEDAVATGTLASKLVRQATKWDGHGAFVLLRNGYVFNGPQTATILLAELSKMRLRRDEDASAFCLRLVELIEDLELVFVPGDAAIYLTDTQKLGYLLSAIRHETGLQSVYTQLQSEQLRGTVSFDQACRELHHRVESMKADDLVDGRSGKALISTEGKKKGMTTRYSVGESTVPGKRLQGAHPTIPSAM